MCYFSKCLYENYELILNDVKNEDMKRLNKNILLSVTTLYVSYEVYVIRYSFEGYLQRKNLVSCNLVRLMDYSMQNI